jgi:hypothetical protein
VRCGRRHRQAVPDTDICALLGTPRDDWRLFSEWADDIFKFFDWNVVNDGPDILRAWKELEAYLDDMVAQRRGTLTDDLLSDMMRAEVGGDRLTHDELLTLSAALLMAGTDTTRNQLAAAVQVFCDNPDQWALLAEHPEVAPKAVEEAMRFSPVIFTTMRTAVEDVELAGITIPAGTLVIANTAAANRDPAVYPDPDRFDITREGAPAMLTFGGGIHYCLGAHLARIELAEALTTMARCMPNIPAHRPRPMEANDGHHRADRSCRWRSTADTAANESVVRPRLQAGPCGTAWLGAAFDEAVVDCLIDRQNALALEVRANLLHLTAGDGGQPGRQFTEHPRCLTFLGRHRRDRAVELQPRLRQHENRAGIGISMIGKREHPDRRTPKTPRHVRRHRHPQRVEHTHHGQCRIQLGIEALQFEPDRLGALGIQRQQLRAQPSRGLVVQPAMRHHDALF